ncbi:MAG TPA: alpha/beta hydrolase [Myxococcaceae bacterium]|nr:alpha/beta hydrolase [Myxococcaceae bacterium]
MLRVQDLDIFAVSEGRGPTVLLLHGFPTSSYDYAELLPALSASRRVVMVDLPGFGLSSKPRDYSYSLLAQTDVLVEALRQLEVREAHVVAHDMGTSIACELLARRAESSLPLTLRSLTLMNGSVYQDMAHLTPSQRLLRRPLLGPVFARLSSRTAFRLQFRKLFAHPDAVPDAELDRLWELLAYDDGKLRLPQVVGYMKERMQRAERWHTPLRRLDLPALILWGRRDPVAVFAIAERLAREIPGSRLLTLDELGHYPQLEDPARIARELAAFVDAVP